MGESKSFNFKAQSGIEFQVKRSRRSFAHRFLAPLSLVGILGCGGVTWLVSSALAPQIAQAYTARVDLRMVGQPNETYEGLIRRAEAVARAAAQRSFDRDILVTDVSVMIMGQNQGAIAPILALKVNRGAWKSRPDVSRWATYFPSTKALLGFRDDVIPAPQPAPAAAPATAPAAAPAAAPPTTITPGNVRDIPRTAPTGTPPIIRRDNPQNVPQTPGTPTPFVPTPGGAGTPAQGSPFTPTSPGGATNTLPTTPITNPATPPTTNPATPPTNSPITPPTTNPATPPTNSPITPPTNSPITPPTNSPITPAPGT